MRPGEILPGLETDSFGGVMGAPQRDRQAPSRAAETEVHETADVPVREKTVVPDGSPAWKAQADHPITGDTASQAGQRLSGSQLPEKKLT